MKNLFNISLALVVGFSLFGCAKLYNPSNQSESPYASVMKLHVRDACNVQKNGVNKVLALAQTYNPVDIKEGIEFMRFGVPTSEYIRATKQAIKDGSKTVQVYTRKGKKGGKFTVAFAAWRSCAFAVAALQQKVEAKSTWKLAMPGTGFKY